MSAATITSKGQITIPKEIRARLGLHSGDKVSFIIDDQGGVQFVPVTRHISSLKGIVSKPRKPVSVDDMNAAIKARASQR